jgi:hypothetical protein
MLKSKINDIMNEKMTLEELAIELENDVKLFKIELEKTNTIINVKNEEIKTNESNISAMIKVIEDQKKHISILSTKIKKILAYEEQNKIFYAEKEQELHYLKNFMNSLKNENLNKDKRITDIKARLDKIKEENKKYKKMVMSAEIGKNKLGDFDKLNVLKGSAYMKGSYNIKNHNESLVYDYEKNNESSEEIDNENLKEITVLMKRVLDE